MLEEDEAIQWILPRITTVDGIELLNAISDRYKISQLDAMKLVRKARLLLEEGRLI